MGLIEQLSPAGSDGFCVIQGGRAGTPKDVVSAVNGLFIPECEEEGNQEHLLAETPGFFSGAASAALWTVRH